MVAMQVVDTEDKYMKFRVMYKARPEDAVVVMDASVESLAGLYRVVYAMAGKVRSIGMFEVFVAHQTLSNGDLIEYNKEGFTKAIRNNRMEQEAREESAALNAEALTAVNPPPMMPKNQAFNRKFFKILKITEAKWRKGYEEPIVR